MCTHVCQAFPGPTPLPDIHLQPRAVGPRIGVCGIFARSGWCVLIPEPYHHRHNHHPSVPILHEKQRPSTTTCHLAYLARFLLVLASA